MSKIFDCQQHIADLLNADAFFMADPVVANRIEVITQRVGDIALKVKEALIKVKAGVIVMLPLMTFQGEAGRVSIGLKFAIVVTENPLLNATGKPAEAIVEKILTLLHWKSNGVSLNPNADAGRFKIDINAVRQMQPPAAPNQMILSYTIAVNTDINLN